MQDDQIDNMDELIREAAKRHHPAYVEEAWIKMAALLDKQLPEKKDRKRPAVLFAVGLLIAFILSLLILNPWSERDIPGNDGHFSKITNDDLQLKTAKDQPVNIETLKNAAAGIPLGSHCVSQNSDKDGIDETIKKSMPKNRFTSSKGYVTINGSDAADNGIEDTMDGASIKSIALPEIEKQFTNEDNSWLNGHSSEQLKETTLTIISPIVENDLIDKTVGTALISKSTEAANSKSPSDKLPGRKNAEGGFQNNFAIILSAGPDLSFVRLGAVGKARLYYGAGLSYTFAKRITLSSGLYIGNKTYSAAPGDYHPPKGYWTYTTKLQRVDADCKVYEIPLSASYNFKQSKNHSWMAGIGFSTFLMKSETYHYLYKNSQGLTVYKGWTLRNKNNHYFSVITITGGYQYRINHHFALIAAPYLKLPLQGIGFGKINLNSGGLLITAAIRPFAKRI